MRVYLTLALLICGILLPYRAEAAPTKQEVLAFFHKAEWVPAYSPDGNDRVGELFRAGVTHASDPDFQPSFLDAVTRWYLRGQGAPHYPKDIQLAKEVEAYLASAKWTEIQATVLPTEPWSALYHRSVFSIIPAGMTGKAESEIVNPSRLLRLYALLSADHAVVRTRFDALIAEMPKVFGSLDLKLGRGNGQYDRGEIFRAAWESLIRELIYAPRTTVLVFPTLEKSFDEFRFEPKKAILLHFPELNLGFQKEIPLDAVSLLRDLPSLAPKLLRSIPMQRHFLIAVDVAELNPEQFESVRSELLQAAASLPLEGNDLALEFLLRFRLEAKLPLSLVFGARLLRAELGPHFPQSKHDYLRPMLNYLSPHRSDLVKPSLAGRSRPEILAGASVIAQSLAKSEAGSEPFSGLQALTKALNDISISEPERETLRAECWPALRTSVMPPVPWAAPSFSHQAAEFTALLNVEGSENVVALYRILKPYKSLHDIANAQIVATLEGKIDRAIRGANKTQFVEMTVGLLREISDRDRGFGSHKEILTSLTDAALKHDFTDTERSELTRALKPFLEELVRRFNLNDAGKFRYLHDLAFNWTGYQINGFDQPIDSAGWDEMYAQIPNSDTVAQLKRVRHLALTLTGREAASRNIYEALDHVLDRTDRLAQEIGAAAVNCIASLEDGVRQFLAEKRRKRF